MHLIYSLMFFVYLSISGCVCVSVYCCYNIDVAIQTCEQNTE